jgi:nucleoside 2-deoxyribosyltransferase
MLQYIAYLAGPITGLSYQGANDWRDEFIKLLPPEIIGISPLRAKKYLKEEKHIKSEYSNLFPLSTSKGIKTRDKNDCFRSDIVIVNFLGANKVSIGTVMEIAWADAAETPVILIMEEGNIHDHPMIKESVGFVVQSLSAAAVLASAILLP